MTKPLTSYLMKLSEDSAALSAFKGAPHQEMEKAGLSAEEKELVLSADPNAIRAAMTGDASTAGFTVTVVIVAVVIIQ